MSNKWNAEDLQKALKRRKNIDELNQKLLDNIKSKLPELEVLLKEVSGDWVESDLIYRYYHRSFKVFHLQGYTLKMIEMFKNIAPDDYKLNDDFMEIAKEGTGKEFKMEDNREWGKSTRPIVESFLHAKTFLENIIKSGKAMDRAPQLLPSSWALTLYLFNLR
jgi:hypothetical protein